MKNPLWMPLGCLLWLTPALALAGKPPVEVDVVVDDAEDDFFDEPADAKPDVKKKAAALHEELDGETGAGVSGDAKNVNTNTQVVKVVVIGDKDSNNPTTTTTQTAPVAPAAPAVATVPAVPVPPAAPPPAQPTITQQTQPKEWWDAPSYVDEGEFLLSAVGGGYAAGGYIGMIGEGLATEQIGLRMSGIATGFEGGMVGMGKFNGNFDITKGGVWANQRAITKNNIEEGFAWLIDASMVFHLLERSMIDPYVTAGLAHYGYELHFKDQTERGGAGYTRLGAGANIHFSRFFAGADFGWYPLELFRYELVERSPKDVILQGERIDDRFVAERWVASLHAGLRF
jgi:hypothetical protein